MDTWGKSKLPSSFLCSKLVKYCKVLPVLNAAFTSRSDAQQRAGEGKGDEHWDGCNQQMLANKFKQA